jgi:hypothetical protein
LRKLRELVCVWSPIQQWLLQLRRRGLAVLIVHHAGKILSCRSRVYPRSVGQRGSADNPRFRGDRVTDATGRRYLPGSAPMD